jgi:hypothetical protein
MKGKSSLFSLDRKASQQPSCLRTISLLRENTALRDAEVRYSYCRSVACQEPLVQSGSEAIADLRTVGKDATAASEVSVRRFLAKLPLDISFGLIDATLLGTTLTKLQLFETRPPVQEPLDGGMNLTQSTSTFMSQSWYAAKLRLLPSHCGNRFAVMEDIIKGTNLSA